jgi:predicted unusual protein kinase regulating ubiquinone biosynthesis (AarF/ABC1/UbiB family)
VHCGVLQDGTRVAVKVQYPDVKWKFTVDLQCITNTIRIGTFFNMINRHGASPCP